MHKLNQVLLTPALYHSMANTLKATPQGQLKNRQPAREQSVIVM
jgi:hypothetical protein